MGIVIIPYIKPTNQGRLEISTATQWTNQNFSSMEFAHLLEVMIPSVPVNEVTRKDLYGWNLRRKLTGFAGWLGWRIGSSFGEVGLRKRPT